MNLGRAIHTTTTVRGSVTPPNTVTTEAVTTTTDGRPASMETTSSVALAKNACTQYSAGIEAITAVINDSNAGRAQIAAAVRAASLAASEDGRWARLAQQLEHVAADQKTLSPTMARDLAAADALCAPLSGPGQPPPAG
jgi:hypothetical protein